MTLPEYTALILNLVAAVSHVLLGIVSLATAGRSRNLNRYFALLALIAGWWAFWVTFNYSRPAGVSHRFMGMASLFSGYFGAATWIFSRATLNLHGTPSRKTLWLLLGGVPGTIIGCIIPLMPEEKLAAMHQCLTSGQPGCVWSFGSIYILYLVHSVQGLFFVLAAVIFVVKRRLGNADRETRKRAGILLAAMLLALVAYGIANILPQLWPGGSARFAPIATLPSVIILYLAVVDAKKLLDQMAEQQFYMGKYLPKELVLQIYSGQHSDSLGGKEEEATILFSDIRDFTALSEKLGPGDVVDFLNRYLSVMSAVVFRHRGMVNKFIGDAILAVFGVRKVTGENDAQLAVDCARDMIASLAEFNTIWQSEGHPPVSIGIGLHRGSLIHGNIGSESRMEYTVIGDVVNAASRLEGLTKDFRIPLIFSDSVRKNLVGENVRFLDAVRVKGKSEVLEIFTLNEL